MAEYATVARASDSLVVPPAMIRGTARGDSMRGLIEPGEEFTVIPVPHMLPKTGDVVAFTIPVGPHKGELASHVVIGRDKDGNILTRGVNNSFNDPWCCTPGMFKGKVANKTYDISKFSPAGPTPVLKPVVVTASRIH